MNEKLINDRIMSENDDNILRFGNGQRPQKPDADL